MRLTETEYKTYLSVHLDLLFYAGQRGKIIADNLQFNIFLALTFSMKFKCREFLLNNKKILDDYTAVNIHRLTTEEISIINGFKKAVTSDFVIYKCLSKNAIFINIKDNKFYAVKALGDSFDKFFNRFPVLVKTTILPFNDQIIYDGFINSDGIYIGPKMSSNMKKDYMFAKKNNKIHTTL